MTNADDDQDDKGHGATDGLLFWLLLLASLAWIVGAIAWGLAWAEQGALANASAANLGAFLQGLFAPVTFLWVIGAVWFQTRELREQRRELALTRDEVRQNRKVAQAQAAEARKQAKIMTEEADQRRQDRAERDALSVLEQLGQEIYMILDAVSDMPMDNYRLLSGFDKYTNMSFLMVQHLGANEVGPMAVDLLGRRLDALDHYAADLQPAAMVRLKFGHADILRQALRPNSKGASQG